MNITETLTIEEEIGLEREWRESNIKLRDKELLEIFPEAKNILKRKMRENNKRIKELTTEIKKDLSQICLTIKDEFSLYFWKEYVKIFKGQDLDNLIRENKKIYFLLNPPIIEENGKQITAKMIEVAKQYPFKNLIETKKNFALCPFHKEKTPSFYVKNNYFKCFGCGTSGSVIDFVMKIEKLSFVEAVKFLLQ